VTADRQGFVTAIDARALGMLLVSMGGGRERKEDAVDHAVGIRLVRKVGEPVIPGETLAIIEARRDAPDWAETARRAYAIGDQAPPPRPLVLEAPER
jgi:thymidine phosphorylase